LNLGKLINTFSSTFFGGSVDLTSLVGLAPKVGSAPLFAPFPLFPELQAARTVNTIDSVSRR
jgi:hypothetical protein